MHDVRPRDMDFHGQATTGVLTLERDARGSALRLLAGAMSPAVNRSSHSRSISPASVSGTGLQVRLESVSLEHPYLADLVQH
jgi:hypothetical protein